MYIRNVLIAFEDLKDDEELLVNFRSGKQCTIKKTDKLINKNGDLIATRIIPSKFEDDRRCVIYIDSAEVECVILHKRSDLI